MNILDNKAMVLDLMATHNTKVKPEYNCDDYGHFLEWLSANANDAEQYIEIAGNQTLSGHAEILDW